MFISPSGEPGNEAKDTSCNRDEVHVHVRIRAAIVCHVILSFLKLYSLYETNHK